MPFFDLPREELEDYHPLVPEPEDLDAFWRETLTEHAFAPASVTTRLEPTPLRTHTTYDVTFGGYGGDPVLAWLTLPAQAEGPLPCVVELLGMGGGRGLPWEHLAWAAAGYAHLVMDTRGQGAGWGSGGSTPDPHGSGPAAAGVVTRGIDSPRGYYYRRFYVDAHHAVEAAATLPQVDPARIVVAGTSQGGALAIAAAALSTRVAAALPNVPFLCHVRRCLGLTAESPLQELVTYLSVNRDRERQCLETLSYFDGAALARRASAPALFSTALMDTTCPPSSVFAARNAWGLGAHGDGGAPGAHGDDGAPGRPEIIVYPYNGHEGGCGYLWREQVAWLDRLWS